MLQLGLGMVKIRCINVKMKLIKQMQVQVQEYNNKMVQSGLPSYK